MTDEANARGIRLRRLRLIGPSGTSARYETSFLDESSEWIGLAVIAGPSQTGKTSIIDFVRYCLGAATHPQHPEVLRAVRTAQLEVELAGRITTIERAASGEPSSYASVWEAGLDDLLNAVEMRLSTDTSDDAGLSQFILASFELDHVELPEAPSRSDSSTDTLSIRDVFKIMWLPNDRIDGNNLVFEHSERIVAQKFRQTIDLMFGVLDTESGGLQAQITAAAQAARQAQAEAKALRDAVAAEYPTGPFGLEATVAEADATIAQTTRLLTELDSAASRQDKQSIDLRQRLTDSEHVARAARLRVGDRESLLLRLSSLREQYADDKRKLTFLSQAEQIFDPLQVDHCPACASSIDPVQLHDGVCGLCHSALQPPTEDGQDEDRGAQAIALELKATSRKLDELQQYVLRLESGLAVLKQEQSDRENRASADAAAIDALVELPAPFLAQRDTLSRTITEARLTRRDARAGLRMWSRVTSGEARADLLLGQAARLRKERSTVQARPDRRAIARQLSERFAKVLADFGYPKLSGARLDDGLVPHVRGLSYQDASSGGRTLIALAWYLALWEIAWEEGGLAPGLLMLDSPQKNLGHNSEGDPDFADANLVLNFYEHIREWQRSKGSGSQIVVVDNSPPTNVADAVVVRFTRSADDPPYGLITDAVD